MVKTFFRTLANYVSVQTLLMCALVLMSFSAFAAEAAPVLQPLAETATKVGWASAALALALQLAKTDLFGGIFAKISTDYQPAVVLLLGQLGALIEAVNGGKSLGQASIEWLLTSGNAMALYAVAIKPFTEKKLKAKAAASKAKK